MRRLDDLRSRVDKIDGFYSALKERQSDLNGEIASLKSEQKILDKTSKVIKHLLDIMVVEEIAKMSSLVTYGLKTIFDDQNLVFNPVINRKNNKVSIELITENNGIEGEFGSFGGSVAVIESFLLRILCMMKMKLARFIVLDETFASVGDEYIPNTSRLISEMAKKLGLDVLLVTHQKEFQSHADKVYRVKESPSGLIMEKIK